VNDNLSQAWGRLLLGSLASSGVTDVVLSPGSRSTPLALAAAAEPRLTVHRVLDERVAGFYALGQARVTGRPSVLVCTSGTAAAHYLPAVIEASESHLPLIVLSADRPWELRHVGAAQTTDQVHLFGRHVRHFADLGPPDGTPSALRGVSEAGARAVLSCRWPSPGPVHLNAQLRKPLEPTSHPSDAPWQEHFERTMAAGAPRLWPPASRVDDAAVAMFVEACRGVRAGVIACGPAPVGVDAVQATRAVGELARATGFVVLAEATSQVRPTEAAPCCSRFDLFLADPAFRAEQVPELLVELWGGLASTSYARYVADHPSVRRIVVAPYGALDPTGGASDSVVADPMDLAERAASSLRAAPAPSAADSFRGAFQRAEQRAERAVAASIEEQPRSEAAMAAALVAALPKAARLVVGNSSPVRDIDAYGDWLGRLDVRVLHQRGVNGIDGMIAGAAGARSVSSEPVIVFVGDSTALHDAGGFAAATADARTDRPPLVVVVVNNHGGRLFERLPIADPRCPAAGAVEELFVMPQRANLGALCEAYGVGHGLVKSGSGLAKEVGDALSRPAERNGEGRLLPASAVVLEAQVPPGEAVKSRAMLVRDCFALRPHAVRARTADVKPGIVAPDRGESASSARLTLVHGFLGEPAMWQDVLDHVIAPARLLQLPGHGRDAAEHAELPLSGAFERAVDELVRPLAPGPSVLCGYSMGARLAMGMACRHAERFCGLVLVAGHPGLTSKPLREERQAWEEEQALRLRRDGLVAFSDAWGRLPMFSSQASVPPGRIARQRASRRRHTEEGIAWAIRALGLAAMPDWREMLGALRLPTWLVVGQHDLKYRGMAEELATGLYDARVVVVPDVGHNVALEAPERLAALLNDIASQRPRPGTDAASQESRPTI